MVSENSRQEKAKPTSIEKSLQIIDLLKRSSGAVNLSDISQDLGFNKSTVHHILQTFVRHECAYQHTFFPAKHETAGHMPG